MRKIKIESWKASLPELDGDGNVVGKKEVEENLLVALNNLIGAKKPEEIPRGIEKFQIFGKLANSFDKAQKTKVLELEEREYNFLKQTIEKDVPSTWAMNKHLNKAIMNFLEAKEE